MDTVNEKYSLNERATVCKATDGFGIVIVVYSEDHGILGSKTNPAHAHVKTPQGRYLGKFAITNQPPRSASYVFDVDKKIELTNEIKDIIVKWGKSKTREGISCWSFLKDVWRALHP